MTTKPKTETKSEQIPIYRQFCAYGFLRVKRWDSLRGEYVVIGSFAGPDAPQAAAARIAEDCAALAKANA